MKSKYIISGTFLKAGVINHNGRSYSEEALAAAVKQFEERKYPMYGEIGYSKEAVIHLKSISHKVNAIKLKYEKLPRKKKKQYKKSGIYNTWRNNHCDLVGEVELLDTPSGEIAKSIVKEFPNNYVVRPFGTGNINEKGEVENYNLISFSLVNKEDDAYKGIID